jgi:hypothetical protein
MSEVQRRIVIDRVYLTLQIPSLFSELGNGFDKRLYEELRDDDVKSKFLKRIAIKKRGNKKGDWYFRVPTETWKDDVVNVEEKDEIASLAISLRAPYIGRAYFNVNRLYLKKHGIDPYEYSYRDDNVIPIHITEDENGTLLKEYCKLFSDRLQKFKYEYVYYLSKVFGLDWYFEEHGVDSVELSIQSSEVCVEFLGCESLQFSYITAERKNNYLKVFGDMTQTEYYTPARKSLKVQFKRYQKGAGINRHEFTWNGELSRNWLLHSNQDYLYYSILQGVRDSYALFGFDYDTLKPLKLRGEDIVQDYAGWWRLPLGVVKTILFGRAYILSFDFHTKGLREKLKAQGLIVPLERELGGKKGLWRWTDTVQNIRLSIRGMYRCKCGSIMIFDDTEKKYLCPDCGAIEDYSKYSIGSLVEQRKVDENIR